MVILVDYPQYIKCKDIFLIFTKQFFVKPKNSIEFFMYHKKLIEKEPQLMDYMYQFALSACYEKKVYNSQEMEIVFNNVFKIKDVYGMNGFGTDISTLNTAFVLNHMVKNTSFNKIPLTIFNPPLEYDNPICNTVRNNFSVKEYIEQSLEQTGQPHNDCAFGGMCYDIKHTKKTTFNLNHLHPWTYERLLKEGDQYLDNLCGVLAKNKNANTFYLYLKALKKTTLPINDKLEYWNRFLSDNWILLEKHNIKMPLVVLITNKPYVQLMPQSLHENLHVNNEVIEKYVEARRAIAGITMFYGQPIIQNAYEMTDGLINSTLLTEDLD